MDALLNGLPTSPYLVCLSDRATAVELPLYYDIRVDRPCYWRYGSRSSLLVGDAPHRSVSGHINASMAACVPGSSHDHDVPVVLVCGVNEAAEHR
jgi:hypothetical protein